jgi:hypothetical protein
MDHDGDDDDSSPDHYPPWWWRVHNRNHDTRKEWLDDYNNEDEMRPLCRSCNKRHRFENTPTEKLPFYPKYNGPV